VAVWAGISGLAVARDAGNDRLIMFTLTFRGVMDWAPKCIRAFSRWLARHGSKGYVWVAELQKRGAVHYHVLALWPIGAQWVKPGKETGGWTRGFTWVTDNVQKPFYLMKYIQKGTKDGRIIRYPKGIRIYGVSRGAVHYMPDSVKDTYRAIHLPSWYRQGATTANKLSGCKRVTGGVSRGKFIYLSPYAARVPTLTESIVADMWYNRNTLTELLAQ
jgi:hypothetical protein